MEEMVPLLLLFCSACASPPHSPPPQRPDVVLLLIDTLRADHLGAYGATRPTTPNLDALAAEGVVYTRAYAQSCWTLSSVASLLTGLYPHEHLVKRDGSSSSRFGALAPSAVALAESARAAGYSTGAWVNNTFLAPEFALNQGFDTYDWQGADQSKHRTGDETVAQALRWLDQQTGPTFLLVHLIEPHMSYVPPDDVHGTFASRSAPPLPYPYLPSSAELNTWITGRYQPSDEVKAYMGALYAEEVLTADRAAGRLVAGLKARARWSQTALIVTADHGEELWDHGGFEHGDTLYGEVTRVPLIAAGAIPRRGQVHTVVELLDLYQGVLALMGADRPAGTHGEILWDLRDVPGAPSRVALSESPLYGNAAASVVDRDARLVFDLATKLAEAWAVDADGRELERLHGERRDQVGARLFPVLQARRPNLTPLPVEHPITIDRPELFDQLRSLGYIEAEPATP